MSAPDVRNSFDLPERTEPNYMAWPLEKLQAEYRELKMQSVLKDMEISAMQETVWKAQKFIDAFNAMVETEGER